MTKPPSEVAPRKLSDPYKTGEDIWKSFTDEMYEFFGDDAIPVVHQSMFILLDAVVAFDAGAYFAASVACRAAVEFAGFNFLTVKWNDLKGPWRNPTPRDLAGRFRTVTLAHISGDLGRLGQA